MLAFLPWLQLDADIRMPELTLLRFERGHKPGRGEQAAVDAILSAYVVGANRPIGRATLIQLPGHGLTDDLSDDERDELFALGELIAFSGLSARDYFSPFGYSNRDVFTLIIQGFGDPAGGVAVRSRRRDGSTMAYVSPGANLVREPHHVPGTWSTKLDEPLLQALLKTRGTGDWPDIDEALFFFNRANTDSDQVFEQAEIVSTISAFERVLGCRAGRENDLIDRFLVAWPAGSCMLPRHCPRIPGEEKFQARPLVDSWLRDFFQHRGNVGHGRKRTAHPAVWTAEEHLLLGAFAFPLLVKALLAKRGDYAWTWDDQFDVDVFEQLACARLFKQVPEAEEPGDHAGEKTPEAAAPQIPDEDPERRRMVFPWNVIRGEAKGRAMLRHAIERAYAQVGRESAGGVSGQPEEGGAPDERRDA